MSLELGVMVVETMLLVDTFADIVDIEKSLLVAEAVVGIVVAAGRANVVVELGASSYYPTEVIGQK